MAALYDSNDPFTRTSKFHWKTQIFIVGLITLVKLQLSSNIEINFMVGNLHNMNFLKGHITKMLENQCPKETLYSQYNLSYFHHGEAIQFLHGNVGLSCLLTLLFFYQPLSLRALEAQNGHQQARASDQLNAFYGS